MKLKHQSAFQQKSIAADHLFVVKCLVDKYMKTGNMKLHVYAWFADFRKVFETGNKVKKKIQLDMHVHVNGLFFNVSCNLYRHSNNK